MEGQVQKPLTYQAFSFLYTLDSKPAYSTQVLYLQSRALTLYPPAVFIVKKKDITTFFTIREIGFVLV